MKYNNLTTPFLRAFTSLFIILATSGAQATDPELLYRFDFDSNENFNGVGDNSKVSTQGTLSYNASKYKFGTASLALSNKSDSRIVENTAGIASKSDGWTVSFWVCPNGMQAWKDVCGITCGNVKYKIERYSHNGTNAFAMYSDPDQGGWEPGVTYSNNDSDWKNIVFVSNGSGFDIYGDGSFLKSYRTSDGVYGTGTEALTRVCAGVYGVGGGDRTSTALIDEVSVYKGALNAKEIAYLAANTAPIFQRLEGSAITYSLPANATASSDVAVFLSNAETVTFDSAITLNKLAFMSSSGGVTFAGTKPTAAFDYSGIAGEVTYPWAWSGGVSSRTGGLKLTGGAGTSGSPVTFTPNGGSITFDGSGDVPYYLTFNYNDTDTAINFNDAQITTAGVELGKATAIIGGNSEITATKVVLSQGGGSRTANLTVKDNAKLRVTGTTNANDNTASIMFGHWNGPSTFTLQGNAQFLASDTDVLVGQTRNNHTINIEGGKFSAKGIKAASYSSGTNNINISGGELCLGSTGIITVPEAADSKGFNINVTGDATISTASNSISVPISHAVAVAAGNTLTLDGGGTITFTSLTLNDGSKLMVKNGTTVVVNDGTASSNATVEVCDDGSLDIGMMRPKIAGVAEGCTLKVSTIISMNYRICGYTPEATLTLTGALSGTVKLDEETVIPDIDGSTATLTGSVAKPGDATYTGHYWWWDYEFNGNGNNIGSEGTALSWDSSRAFKDNEYTSNDEHGMLHLPARPWRDVTSYPTEFTAVMYCKAGATANGVLVSFGSTAYGSSTKTITLSTGSNPSAGEMRLVYGSGSNSSEDLVEGGFTLDNITSANHLYAFTVKTVDNKSQIEVYADGDLLTTYVADSVISLGTGFQIASGHGGLPSGLSRLSDDDAATMDFLRVSNVALSEAAIKALAEEYRYVSPNGIAERTLSANATWTDETDTSWEQKTLNQDGSTTTTEQAAPNSGTVVEITATSDVQLTMDLASEVSYEKLTFQGDGAITVKAGGTAPTVTTRTYINTDVTMDIAAFASLGATTIADGKTLTLVPDEQSAYITGRSLGIRGIASTTVTGTVTLGTGASVVLASSVVDALATYGFTLSLEQDVSGRYVYGIARNDNPVYITKAAGGTVTYEMYPDGLEISQGVGWTLPSEPATIPEDFASLVTIVNNHASDSLTVATVFAGGAVPVTVSSGSSPVVLSGDSTFGGTITLNGATEISGAATISSSVSGSGALTIDGTVTLANGGSIANTISGNGTIAYQVAPNSGTTAPSFHSTLWTGTVELPVFNAAGIKLEEYGTSHSKIKINGITGGYLYWENQNIQPEIVLAGDFIINDMSQRDYTFAKFSGAGNISFSPGSYELKSLIITKLVEGYSGIVTNTMSKTALTITTLALPEGTQVAPGTKLLATGGTGTINVNGLTIGGEEFSGITLERRNQGQANDGIYVAQQVRVDDSGETPITIVETDKSTANITLPTDYAGTVEVSPNVSSVTTTGTSLATDKVVVKYGETNISSAFTFGGSDGAITLTLKDGDKDTVNVEGEDIYVKPKVAASSPMTLGGTTPGFTVKTIPGLYYVAETCSTPDGEFARAGTPQQATDTSTSLTTTDSWGENEKVKYYRIKVSTSAD